MVGGITGGGGAGAISNSYANYNNVSRSGLGGNALANISGVNPILDVDAISNVDSNIQGIKGVEKLECQTCKERTYVDGSDEGNVSFKAPGHISPEASASVVAAHEQEHVANAQYEGSKEGAELVSANVRLQTAVCPECGSAYVAGGVTSTTIKYDESSPYDQGRKIVEGSLLAGRNIDLVA